MTHDERRQKRLEAVERWSSRTAVGAGIVAAVTGGLGLLVAAVASGCIAAVSPVIGQVASNRLRRAAKVASDARVATAEQALADLRQRLGPRRISPDQSAIIAEALNGVPPFAVGVNHNRHEAEQSEYSEQLRAALRVAGLEVGWFGGATNATRGMEVSGLDTPNKRILLSALTAAGVEHTNIALSDDPEGKRGVEVWVGVHPGA